MPGFAQWLIAVPAESVRAAADVAMLPLIVVILTSDWPFGTERRTGNRRSRVRTIRCFDDLVR